MSNITIKQEVLARLQALKSVNTPLRSGLKNSFASLNNSNNPLYFVLDIVRSLLGDAKIGVLVSEFVSSKLGKIEKIIKEALKAILIKRLSCNLDFIIPDEYIDQVGSGFKIAVKHIDFFKILKIDPNSVEGEVIFQDAMFDLNRVLADTIRTGSGYWKNFLVITYNQQGIVNGKMHNEVLTIKINQEWQGKYIKDFIGNLFDSVKFFDVSRFLMQLFNYVFGSLNSLLGIDVSTVENESLLDEYITRFIELDDIEIDDSYFDLSSARLNEISQQANTRRNGGTIIATCSFVESRIDPNLFFNVFDSVLNVNGSNFVELQRTISLGIFNINENFLNQSGSDSAESPNVLLKLNFEYIKGIVFNLFKAFLSPQAILIIRIYGQLLGRIYNYNNFRQFLKEFGQILKELVVDKVFPKIIDFFLNILLKEIKKLVVQNVINKKREQLFNYKIQQLGLLPIPPELLLRVQQILNI